MPVVESPDLEALRLQPDGSLGWSTGYARIRLRSWSDGLALERRTADASGWKAAGVVSALTLLDPTGAPVSRDVDAFTAQVPAWAQVIAAKVRYGQHELLRLLRHSAAARDLAATVPLLVWIAAVRWPARALATVDESLRQRRVDLLGTLFGPQAASTARLRFLQKVSCSMGFDAAALGRVEHVLGAPSFPEAFRHAPRVTTGQLEHFLGYPTLVEIPFVRRRLVTGELTDAELREIHINVADTREMARRIDRRDIDQRLATCASPGSLGRLHDELVEVHRQREVERMERVARMRRRQDLPTDDVFPAPPVEGTDTIVPIRTADELAHEGLLMRHCAHSYGARIADRQCYLYRVLAPERGTVEICPRSLGKGYEIRQLRGPRNAALGEPTWRAVRDWLTMALVKGEVGCRSAHE